MFKSFIFILLISSLIPAMAADTKEFLDRYVQAVNDEIEMENELRCVDGKKLYCESLSEEQKALIYSQLAKANAEGNIEYRDGSDRSAQEFISAIADKLYCYPLACPKEDRYSLIGMICNAKSFNMDLDILREALKKTSGKKYSPYNSMDLYIK